MVKTQKSTGSLLGLLIAISSLVATLVNGECCGLPVTCGPSLSQARVNGIRVIYSTTKVCSSKDISTEPFSCCGNGPCNIFCCNCDDGCIKFDRCPRTSAATSPSRRSVGPPGKFGRRPFPPPLGDKFVGEEDDDMDLEGVEVDTCPTHATSSVDCTRHKFDLIDSSIEKDGKITIQEFIAGWSSIDPHFSEELWKDPETYIKAVEHFRKFDADGDNVLTFSEAFENKA
ncbi:hypothetical protein B0A52_09161 [Exophiala mesophila]|uniref:Uncharacterized protein n=1 Tax=Exophiala mesophila TaxID=212818 RepID=A0A438MUG6_EXOME|nr:hypothetical protein B0A52_09161 [Exophiala mesophila]